VLQACSTSDKIVAAHDLSIIVRCMIQSQGQPRNGLCCNILTSVEHAMDVRFNLTRAFEKQFGSLTGKERERVAANINQIAELYLADSVGLSRLATPFNRKVLGGYDSSLYTAKLSHKDRLIFSAEDDPIQGEVVVTLFALTTPEKYSRAIESITESLYQERLHADEVEGLVHDSV